MNPLVIVVPLVLLVSGVATFFLLPLDLGIRLALLVSDVLAAAIVGFVLWRRSQR